MLLVVVVEILVEILVSFQKMICWKNLIYESWWSEFANYFKEEEMIDKEEDSCWERVDFDELIYLQWLLGFYYFFDDHTDNGLEDMGSEEDWKINVEPIHDYMESNTEMEFYVTNLKKS